MSFILNHLRDQEMRQKKNQTNDTHTMVTCALTLFACSSFFCAPRDRIYFFHPFFAFSLFTRMFTTPSPLSVDQMTQLAYTKLDRSLFSCLSLSLFFVSHLFILSHLQCFVSALTTLDVTLDHVCTFNVQEKTTSQVTLDTTVR